MIIIIFTLIDAARHQGVPSATAGTPLEGGVALGAPLDPDYSLAVTTFRGAAW
jgi:hypothetical protein